MLPVSLQVLDAGEGGGGISIRSAVSLWLLLFDVFAPPLPLDSLFSGTFPEGAVAAGTMPTGKILKRQTASRFHTAVSNWPTFGTPFAMVKAAMQTLDLIFFFVF